MEHNYLHCALREKKIFVLGTIGSPSKKSLKAPPPDIKGVRKLQMGI